MAKKNLGASYHVRLIASARLLPMNVEAMTIMAVAGKSTGHPTEFAIEVANACNRGVRASKGNSTGTIGFFAGAAPSSEGTHSGKGSQTLSVSFQVNRYPRMPPFFSASRTL